MRSATTPTHIRSTPGSTPGNISRDAPGDNSGDNSGGGFTLMEVLMALAILALGMIAISSIFPTAIMLQKQAVETTLGHQYTRSAEAMLYGKGINHNLLTAGTPDLPSSGAFADAFKVYSLYEIDADITNGSSPPSYDSATLTTDSYLFRWPLEDRSFPTVINNTNQREFYWVPLVRRTDFSDLIPAWDVFVFILKRDNNATYVSSATVRDTANPLDSTSIPKVWKIAITSISGNRIDFNNSQFGSTPPGEPDQVRIGDMVLADNGVVYQVNDADSAGINVSGTIGGDDQTGRWPAAIWYGRPPAAGKSSPIRDIRLLSADVVRELIP